MPGQGTKGGAMSSRRMKEGVDGRDRNDGRGRENGANGQNGLFGWFSGIFFCK